MLNVELGERRRVRVETHHGGGALPGTGTSATSCRLPDSRSGGTRSARRSEATARLWRTSSSRPAALPGYDWCRVDSFIGELLQRHPNQRLRWPGEDLSSTEATAGVLRRVDGLPQAIVANACGCGESAVEGEVVVSTQRPAGVGRIDLELAIQSQFLVWIEIKDEAPLSGDQQLNNYLRALTTRPFATKRLVYFATSGRVAPTCRDPRRAGSMGVGAIRIAYPVLATRQ